MLDIEELAYVSLPPEMPNYTTDKLIIFSCGSETYHIKCILIFNWPPSNLSDWLLLSANLSIFRLCYAKNKYIFNEMMVRFAMF
jgi:hypothetical protein